MDKTSLQSKQPIEFTKENSDKVLKLESEIAYFYGAKEREVVAQYELFAKVGDGAYQEASFSSLAMSFPTMKTVPLKMTFGN